MDKCTKFIGIDISKDVFDVMDTKEVHRQYENNNKGFMKFLKCIDSDHVCVMEATAYYHLRLAYFLFDNHLKVIVVNPLSVKRFVQMKLSKVKTDKADSKMIRLYAENNPLPLWQAHNSMELEALQITRLLDVYTKQSTAIKNKIHGEEVLGKPSAFVLKSLKRNLNQIQKEIVILESKLLEIVKSMHQQLLSHLESIPGIGRKTAIMLIVLTDGFKRFDSASALCSYCGITPVIKQSGSSVRGRARISKIGNQKLRNLLFLCSFTACQANPACKALYERIVNKGKSKKLALIAVSNKLLKQAFAISKSGIPYDKDYKSVYLPS